MMRAKDAKRAAVLLQAVDEIIEWQDTPGADDRKKWDTMRAEFVAFSHAEATTGRDEGYTIQGFGGGLTLPMDLYDTMLADLRKRAETELRTLDIEIDENSSLKGTPMTDICDKLQAVSNVVTKNGPGHINFCMSIPAEPDHDIDLIAMEAKTKIEGLSKAVADGCAREQEMAGLIIKKDAEIERLRKIEKAAQRWGDFFHSGDDLESVELLLNAVGKPLSEKGNASCFKCKEHLLRGNGEVICGLDCAPYQPIAADNCEAFSEASDSGTGEKS